MATALITALVHEVFVSVQGEQPGLGLPTGFIRVWGCNRRCSWCDVGYVPDEKTYMESFLRVTPKKRMTAHGAFIELLKEGQPFQSVEITGGEPLVYKDWILELAKKVNEHFGIGFSARKCRVETNAELLTEEYLTEVCGLMTFIASPKLPRSHAPSPNIRQTINLAIKYPRTVFLKFVIADQEDYDYLLDLLDELKCYVDVAVQPSYEDLTWHALWDMYVRRPPKYCDIYIGHQFHKQVKMP